MRSLIICFSQTGNTNMVARHIQGGMAETVKDVSIVNLADVDVGSLQNYDLVGLGCPVFYYKEPFNVSEFIENLPMLEGKHWFVFCSHGSVMGLTLLNMAAGLERKGVKVIGSHHTYADGSLPFYPYPAVTCGHPDEQDLAKAREFGARVAQCSRKASHGDESCIEQPGPPTETWAEKDAAALSRGVLAKVMPRLSINEETCIQCQQCQDACPVGGIDVKATPPLIQAPCIYCYYCVKICPICAIEADWEPLVKTAPQTHSRYIRALNDAESRGEFEWHIDPQDINFDDPLYQQQKRKALSKVSQNKREQ